jgi:hypothetical protein
MKRIALIAFATTTLVSASRAQDDDPFADLDADLAPQTETKAPVEKPSAKPSPVDASVDDSELSLDTDEGLREVLNPKGDAPDADLGALEEKVEAPKIEAPVEEVPQALLTDVDPGLGLEPSDQFYRVPLRPPMSEKGWQKWAGPALEKIYRVRRGDSLWVISERLFGNPYLWPKVWQLNAEFENPHIIEIGTELQFLNGGPSSAPKMAFKWKTGPQKEIPFQFTQASMSFIESLELIMKRQSASSDPPFKSFLIGELPEEVERIPKHRPKEPGLYYEGFKFYMDDIDDGDYQIVRVIRQAKEEGRKNATYGAYRMRWQGSMSVKQGQVKITRSFFEIEAGDMIIKERFDVPVLNLQEVNLGDEGDSVRLVPVEEGAYIGAAAQRTVGARFGSDEVAPPGSIVTFKRGFDEVGRAVVIHRQDRFGTLWIFDAKGEVLSTDKLK